MTVKEIQYQIASRLNRDDNEEFLNSLIPSIYGNYARLLRQRRQRGSYLFQLERSFDVRLVKDDLMDICNIPGCVVLRSEKKIPRSIEIEKQKPYKISTIDKRNSFDFTTPEQFEFIRYNKHTSRELRYFYINDYIYVVNSQVLKWINIRAQFENPELLQQFTNCVNCEVYNTEIPNELAPLIIRAIIETEFDILQPEESDGEIKLQSNG